MTEFVATADGSLTKFNSETGELYHNRAGAFTEALQNYFEPSNAHRTLNTNKELSLIDACFGLGYNSFVLVERLLAAECQGRVEVLGLETDPEIIGCLPRVLEDERFGLLRAHLKGRLPANFGTFEFTAGALEVQLRIERADLRQRIPQLEPPFDLVFHDPFSARKVPELWSTDLFKCYFRLLAGRQGRLLTYSSATAVRGGLREAGFSIFKTTAVGAKSGGTLASTIADLPDNHSVDVLSEAELQKLQTRSSVPYRDDSLTTAREAILARRERELASR